MVWAGWLTHPAGTYAVRLTVNGIGWLKFILAAGNLAIEMATPEFVVLQDKPYLDANYVDMQAVFDVRLCDMGTGVSTRSVALSNGITRDLNDGTYCARVSTRMGGHLVFFRKQRGTVKYLHAPAFVRHNGY